MKSAKDYGFVAYDDISDKKSALDKYGFTSAQPIKNQKEESAEQSIPEYISRTVGAAGTGYASGTPLGLAANLSNFLAMGDVNDPEEIDRIRSIAEREGVPFDEEKYLEAGRQALGSFPTPSNLARMAEESTGLPLTAKDKFQKGIETAFTAGKAQPGTLSQKSAAAITAPTVSNLAQQAGVPESLSELVGYASGGYAGSKTPSANITSKKPSGMTERRFEKLKKPTEVSEKKVKQINESLENEFRDIASDIIEKSPIEETHAALREDIGFKKATEEGFEKVNELADQIPEIFSTEQVKKQLIDNVLKKKGTGFTPSEYDLAHKKFIKQAIKQTQTKDISARDLVQQYRKNNKAFGELREPGQSSAYNRGKKQALLDYNTAIAEMIEKKYPNSEFSNLFKSTNEKWKKIMDAENIDSFMNELFEGKINYKSGKKLLEKEGLQMPFKRALGNEGYKSFEQLLADLMSTEKAMKLMKVAEKKGFSDLVNHGLPYLIHPSAGLAKSGYTALKSAARKIWEYTLDKPQFTFTWDRGVKAFKKGDFETAEKAFNDLKKNSLESESEKNLALKKFNERLRTRKN